MTNKRKGLHMKHNTLDNMKKAKGIVRYALDYSEDTVQDQLNTLQILTDGIKNGVMWYDPNSYSIASDTCTLAVKMYARYNSIIEKE